jgi:hypothetical protein
MTQSPQNVLASPQVTALDIDDLSSPAICIAAMTNAIQGVAPLTGNVESEK